MNYKKIYDQIINKRKLNIPEGYIEKHHIIPKSLGGLNNNKNLVKLTAREHFICHYLLAKMYKKGTNEWYKMQFAFNMMKINSLNHDRYFNSRLYEALRKDFKKSISILMKRTQQGSNNSQFGTIWICNLELKENKKIKEDEKIPEPWIKGRNKWKIKEIKPPIEKINKHKIKAEFYWKMFKEGTYNSLNEFAKTDYPYSQPNLINMFKKHIPEYSIKSNQGKTICSSSLTDKALNL